MTVVPGLHRLFLDACAGAEEARAFYPALSPETGWQARPPLPAHWPELLRLLGEQNSAPSVAAATALEALRTGAGVVVTGQQVGFLADRSLRP